MRYRKCWLVRQLAEAGKLLAAEAKSGLVALMIVVHQGPDQYQPSADLVEARKQKVEIVTVPHDTPPTEDDLALKQSTEDRGALGLDGQQVGKAELVNECTITLEHLVDGIATHNTVLLVGVEPLLHIL